MENLKSIISKTNKNHRLILLSNKLVENLSSVVFGWRYNFFSESWNEVQFIKKGDKYGLLDEERTWFCMINGFFLERDDLFPNSKEIIEIWNAEKPAQNSA